MESKKILLRIGFAFILIIAVTHTILHYTLVNQLNNSERIAISGLVVSQGTNSSPQEASAFSFSILGIEWLLLITMVIFSLVRQKIEIGTQEVHYNLKKALSGYNSKTDLDVLYELLKNYGSIKVSVAAKLFNVDKSKIVEWTNILESSDLATINYPQMGEPEVVLKK